MCFSRRSVYLAPESGEVQVVLVEVARALVEDDVEQVQAWLDAGQLSKLGELDGIKDLYQPQDPFQLIVVTPFALLKRR